MPELLEFQGILTRNLAGAREDYLFNVSGKWKRTEYYAVLSRPVYSGISFQRSRSEAGRNLSIEPGLSPRLLHLDVRRCLLGGMPIAFQ